MSGKARPSDRRRRAGGAICRRALLLVAIVAITGAACSDDDGAVAAVQAATPSVLAMAAATETPTAPSPQPAPPPQAITPTFVVNSLAVGCHEQPLPDAAVRLYHPPGTVQVMDALSYQADGIWHREPERACWTRTNPGPVAVFVDAQRAACFALAFRRPLPLAADCVTIVTAQGGAPGGTASLLAEAPPGARCTSNTLTVSENALQLQELEARIADPNGRVYWTWEIHPDTRPGTTTVTVTCDPGGTVSMELPVS